eukprot:gb/GECG01009540.1/.p1 GENE.gb/GECG01009540.1/~~gb/GECG01009540.1/.p1  ORF type:complete len:274 (+),score=48.85 gb/GECG01009540.1/:1-822(+)
MVDQKIEVPEGITNLLKNLRDQTSKDAEEVVHTKWPEKIMRLNKLLERQEFLELSKQDIERVGQLPDLAAKVLNESSSNGTSTSNATGSSPSRRSSSKKRKVVSQDEGEEDGGTTRRPTKEEASGPFGSVDWSKFEGGKDGPGPDIPSNKRIIEMMDMLRHEVKEAVSALGTVKMWIQLLVPRIEDGNNFGVEVQEEIISEVSRIEDSSFQVLESLSKYFETRSELVQKYIKHPTIGDYRQAILEYDEMEILNLRMCVVDLRYVPKSCDMDRI